MNEVEFLKYELSNARSEIESLRDELNLADEINYDERQEADRYNNLMTSLVIVMAIWIADLTARHWNCVL